MIKFPKVLFVTNRDDFATDYLIYYFRDKGVPYLRINSEDITELSFLFKPYHVRIEFMDVVYDLSDVKSVYFRRAPTIFPDSIILNDTPFINRERRDFFEGLYLSVNAKWINPIFPTYKAERKLFQLNVASKLGLQIPPTIVSNDPLKVIDFVNENNGCIIKPISHGLQITDEGAFSIYTSEITSMDMIESDKIFESPVLIQKKIENFRDIRVTVVGEKIFAVEIEKNDISSVDWRQPNIVKKYKIHTLPNKIIKQIFDLHKYLQLTYSAIDFILTPNGDYIFLETNPAGEWVWLERELGLEISSAIIEELLN